MAAIRPWARAANETFTLTACGHLYVTISSLPLSPSAKVIALASSLLSDAEIDLSGSVSLKKNMGWAAAAANSRPVTCNESSRPLTRSTEREMPPPLTFAGPTSAPQAAGAKPAARIAANSTARQRAALALVAVADSLFIRMLPD